MSERFDKIIGERIFGDVSEERVNRFFNSIDCKPPADYRNFVLRTNGGTPVGESEYVFVEGSSKPLCDIQYFLGLSSNKDVGALSLDEAWEIYVGRLPNKTCIPIAIDSTGNVICIDCSNVSSYGSVLFWDHEKEHLSSPAEVIAASFSDFLQSLGSFADHSDPEWLLCVTSGNAAQLASKISTGLNPEARYKGRSIIEHAAIHAQNEVIQLLYDKGVSLRSALQLAELNAEFFPKHQRTAELLRSLTK